MKVRMLKEAVGSENGYINNTYTNGHVYEIADSLAQVFVDNKSAEKVEDNVDVTDNVPVGEDAIYAQRPELYGDRVPVRKPALEAVGLKSDETGATSPATKKSKKVDGVENKALDSGEYENKSAK